MLGAMTRRLVQLYVALVLYGVSMALMIRSELGNMPWDVLHQGLAEQLGLPFGVVIVLVSALVLLSWWPLHERPGLGTISNVLVISVVIDPALAIVPESEGMAARVWPGGCRGRAQRGRDRGLYRRALRSRSA